ncbi:ABC transporter substrate-binding protein [Marinimicrobium agarilyticum]|uniref:ABC transporter substrate-binding protein n=1 Tax=Marinimicrobium agarilyticum TaxID=306546 RepID=UPI0003F8752D|nr:ABC transporter substrate-binding protein [Marinimicrobium agarilyticum]
MTKNTKIVSSVLAAVGAVMALALLLSFPFQGAERAQSKDPMRIATYYWPGMYWIDIARYKGWFEEAGLEVTFIDANQDYYGAVAGVVDDRVDTLAVWLFDVMQMSQEGAEVVMVLATDESRGSESLVGSSAINTVEQLRGKRIGVPEETALVYALDVMLSRFGMGVEDVTLVDMDAEESAERLSAGDVDAVMTWEPYATAAAKNGNPLYDTAQTPGLISAGMIFRREFIKERPEDINRLLQVWWRATTFIHSHPEAAFEIVAEAQKVSPEEVKAFAELNQILGLRDNVQAFTYASGLESLFGSARKIQRFLTERYGEGAPVQTPEDVLEGRFVRELAREENSP